MFLPRLALYLLFMPPEYLESQACTTTPGLSVEMGVSLTFLPGLALNYSLTDLHLPRVYDFFFLQVFYWEFLCLCSSRKLSCSFSVSYRLILVSWNAFGSFPSLFIVWNTLRGIGGVFCCCSLKVLRIFSGVNLSSHELLFAGRLTVLILLLVIDLFVIFILFSCGRSYIYLKFIYFFYISQLIKIIFWNIH
jgi:hypothetical protein